MKKVVTFLIAIIIGHSGYSQSLNEKTDKIRKIVERINNDASYKVKILNNDEFLDEMPDGGGQLKAYSKNGNLFKIVESIYLSSCVNTTEYYFDQGKLVFSYTQGKEFSLNHSNNRVDKKKLTLKMECRFYFENLKLVKSILKGRTICSGEPTDELAKNYLENSVSYMKLLKQKA